MEPQMHADTRGLNEVTRKVIGCAYAVANTLGPGFLEKVYENALAYELRANGLDVEQQKALRVYYRGVLVGDYTIDLMVEGAVVVELKAIKAFDDIHLAQCLNYLKATGCRVGLLINFGAQRVQIKRVVNSF